MGVNSPHLKEQIMSNSVWLKSNNELIQALIADEAKNLNILYDTERTINQMISKNRFRLALLHNLNNQITKENK